MSDTLRQTSEQYASRLTALEQQVSDAETNIKNWKKEIEEVKEAKAHIDSKLPKQPKPSAASPSP